MSTKERLKELEEVREDLVAENDDIADHFEVKDGRVHVTEDQAEIFRKNVAEIKELNGLIEGLKVGSETKSLWTPGTDPSADQLHSSAIRAAAGGELARSREIKSLGEAFVQSEEFKDWVEAGARGQTQEFAVEANRLHEGEVKDVYTGLAPVASNLGFGQVQRDPMIPLRHRTTRVRDLFPAASTSANLIEFYKVSGFTNNAGPVRERAAADGTSEGNAVFGLKPQSELQFELGQAPVRTIAHWEVAHRNVLADEPQLQSTINNELRYGLRLEEDAQILNGDGTGENLTGVLQTTGIQTYVQTDDGGAPAAASETKADAMRRSLTKVMLAFYESTGFVLHPNDWEDIELSKDNEGRYILVTSVAIGAESRLWRLPVVATPAMPEGTFLTGAFGLGAQLYDREQSNIRVAEQHADLFIRNAIAVLAEQRLALAVKRPESFVKGTFFVPA